MPVFTYHLATVSAFAAFTRIMVAPNLTNIPGLVHAEYMNGMTLGAPVFSTSRVLIKEVALFAKWENDAAIDTFLHTHPFGKVLATGWHCRLAFLRQWGKVSEFAMPTEVATLDAPDGPVVAVTLARLKLTQLPRFIRWGRPAEMLVRDHPGITLALAAIRLPNTVSTFSVWRSTKEMSNMVHGHSAIPFPKRHVDAMKERGRKDFHFEFTTLRFKPLTECGRWKGRANIIPNVPTLVE